MGARVAAPTGSVLRPVRCRCGHLPTHHMTVVAIAESASFRLDPNGPCALCGESVCHRYTPGG
jgi:hypothetical protein